MMDFLVITEDLGQKGKGVKVKNDEVCESPLEWPRRKGSHMGT